VSNDTFLTVTRQELSQRIDERIAEMGEAQKKGVHFWIAGALFRMSGPSQDSIMLDHENVCGYTPVHCAICGVDNNDDPRCHG